MNRAPIPMGQCPVHHGRSRDSHPYSVIRCTHQETFFGNFVLMRVFPLGKMYPMIVYPNSNTLHLRNTASAPPSSLSLARGHRMRAILLPKLKSVSLESLHRHPSSTLGAVLDVGPPSSCQAVAHRRVRVRRSAHTGQRSRQGAHSRQARQRSRENYGHAGTYRSTNASAVAFPGSP
jgi:hypothetical protein